MKNYIFSVFFTFIVSLNVAVAKECSGEINGTDMMQYDSGTITVGADCTSFELTLNHTGTLAKNVMGHNVVVVAADKFSETVGSISMSESLDAGYLPESELVLAKTPMIGGGESVKIKLDLAKFSKGGDYTFFCSFPGHYAIMRGKLVI